MRENPETGNLEHIYSGKVEDPFTVPAWHKPTKATKNCVIYHHGGSKGAQWQPCSYDQLEYICEIIIA